MGQKHKKTRNYKLDKMKQRQMDNMRATFVDADIFLDAILDESSKGLKFFSSFRGNRKIVITSTHAIGEVVKRVYKFAQEQSKQPDSEYKIDKTIEVFKQLIDSTNIQIENFDDKTKELIGKVMDKDSRIKFKDVIHVALAYQLTCDSFCTFDTGIGKETLREFGMHRIDL